MKFAVFVGILCILFETCLAKDTQSSECGKRKKRTYKDKEDDDISGYIFTIGRVLKKGVNNEFRLQRYGNLDSGTLKVQVFCKTDYNSPNETVAAMKKIKLPKGQSDVTSYINVNIVDDYVYNGRIQINGTSGDDKFSGTETVTFSSTQINIIIIQTDKPIYMPGQTVKFRILEVDKNLKPTNKENIADVYVEDPKGTRLFEFTNINLQKGIVQNEFPVSDEPVQGTWTIRATINNNTQFTTFDVKEYVLPKFELNIKFPPFVLSDAEVIPVEICANYTYGKPVVGVLNLNSSLETYFYYYDYDSTTQSQYPTLKTSAPIDGCYNYNINVSLIELNGDYSYRRVQVVASVVENGTGVELNSTEYLQRQNWPLKLDFIESPLFYKPGLPYTGKLSVSNPDNTPAADEPIEICATVSKKRILAEWWATKTSQYCKNYTSDDTGVIPFILKPQNIDVISVVINAKSTNYVVNPNSSGGRKNSLSQPQASRYLKPFYSPSGSFIQIQPVRKIVHCGVKQTLKVLFTSKENADFKFYYQVSNQASTVNEGTEETTFSIDDSVASQYEDKEEVIDTQEKQIDPPLKLIESSEEGDCVAINQSRYTPPVGAVNIDIKVDPSFSPAIYVLVYYIRDDKEVVADSIKIDIEKCFKNKVNFTFGDQAQQPGANTSIKVTASPNSLCGIKTIDKSVLLLDSSDQLTKDTVFQMVQNLDTNIYYTSNPCYQTVIQPGLPNTAFKSIIRPPPAGISSYEDSLTAFQNSGLLIISDLFVVTRPCLENYNNGGYPYNPRPIYPSTRKTYSANRGSADSAINEDSANTFAGVTSTQSISDVRSQFPETWLFTLEMTGVDGTFETQENLPDTITEWIGSAVCINSEDGLGISDTTTITAFQAFFLAYTLPISVIRGETFVLVVSVFSYAQDALPVTVTLSDSDEYEVANDSKTQDICVHPNTSENIRIMLNATKIGNINITVHAETADSSAVCGSSAVSDSIARDAIRKSLEVEAEGFPVENVINSLLCSSENESFETSVSLSVPDNVVPDSSRAYVDITGNVMGPAINNLDSLVALPTGCGEQNMVKFTPNYLVLDYMTDIGQLTDTLKNKAVRNLNIGYQQELTYRHNDGSFSAFGESDNEGSMFLTAFVMRSFCQARRYITIDVNILEQMQAWILSKQTTDGCFPNIGQIIDIDIQGGIKDETSSGSLTAYVLASLLICKLGNDTATGSAFECLDNNPPSNPYSQSLYAYAEVLAGNKKNAQNYISEARQRLNSSDGMESFIIVNGTTAIKNEAAAYAVLTTLMLRENVSEVLSYIRFLTKNLNPYGGFKSTQDTCVGLDALSQFTKIIYKDPLNLVIATTGGLEKVVNITDANKLLVQRFQVSSIPSEVKVEGKGTGCALIQTAIRFNTKTPPKEKSFSLEVSAECPDTACKRLTINVLVSYLPDGQKSGMSIVEIKMLTGFVPYEDDLNKLKTNQNSNILRIDVDNNNVIFYFLEITNSVIEFSFQADKVIDVKDAKPAIAKVYDYYANENSESTSYMINIEDNDSNGV